MSFTRMQFKLIFIWMALHLDLFWNRGKRQLGNGLFCSVVLIIYFILWIPGCWSVCLQNATLGQRFKMDRWGRDICKLGKLLNNSQGTVGGTSAGFGKSSLKQSNHFWIILSNQKLAQAFTSTLKAIVPANMSCCLATSGGKTTCSIPSRRRDFAISWHFFPRLGNYLLLRCIWFKKANPREYTDLSFLQFLPNI